MDGLVQWLTNLIWNYKMMTCTDSKQLETIMFFIFMFYFIYPVDFLKFNADFLK